jgi:EAL domain-containing protein (putative c-di-GMP-specific phosphodiesterase class I)
MGNAQQTLATLDRLKAMNVGLEIDDFGTGYSSLSYLQRLPFDTLKIDRSFVREMTTGNGSLNIVKAILQLAHSLKLEVIAEGVETESQSCKLRELGCDYLQGYLLSCPVDALKAELLCREVSGAGLISHASALVGAGNPET